MPKDWLNSLKFSILTNALNKTHFTNILKEPLGQFLHLIYHIEDSIPFL
jgi:hypothetical protein